MLFHWRKHNSLLWNQNVENIDAHFTNVSITSTFWIHLIMIEKESTGFGHVYFELNDILQRITFYEINCLLWCKYYATQWYQIIFSTLTSIVLISKYLNLLYRAADSLERKTFLSFSVVYDAELEFPSKKTSKISGSAE